MLDRRASSCDDSRLQLLLRGDEHSDQFREAAEHLEGCAECQQRLTELAAEPQSWSEARQLLSDGAAAAGAAPDRHLPDGTWPISLDFLAQPSHPEMLGRLGRYEIERVIGAGGMGVVLKGFDTELNRPVAIKVLAPHLAHNAAARRRFAREGRAAAAVVHEHVVAIHNVETEGAIPFLVMPFVAGESLQRRVDRQGPLGPKETLRIGIQAAAGLAAAHQQGLVHRDIKPGNILLETGVERALLTDFGLARAIDDASLTHSGVVAGTPHYMSPEQADGQPVDYRSDLFSLGAVLYFMASGHPPFRADRPMAVLRRICQGRHRPLREIAPEIPAGLSDVVDQLLEKRASRRPANAAAVQQALAALLSDLQQGRRSRRRRQLPWRRFGLAAAGLTVIVAILVFSLPWVGPSPRLADRPAVDAGLGSPGPRGAGRPPSPVRQPSGDVPIETLGRLLLFGPGPTGEFAAEAAAISGQISRWELNDAAGDSLLYDGLDDWRAEFTSVELQVQRLEQLPFPDLQPPGVIR